MKIKLFLPEIMNHPNTPKHFVSNRQDAPVYWQVDILWILHASSQQTGGAYTLLEQSLEKIEAMQAKGVAIV